MGGNIPPAALGPLPDIWVAIATVAGAWTGHSNRSCSSLDFHFDAHAGVPEHVDERVEAEVADLAAHDIIQPRLRHAELLCSFALSRPAGDIANARHQLRAQLQVFRFVRGEPDVEEYVATAAGSFQFLSHRCR